MSREIFLIKNVTSSDLEIKSFGLIVSSGDTIELGNYDNSVLSDEIYNYIVDGSIVRIINGDIIPSGSSYAQSNEVYSGVTDYYTKELTDTLLSQKSSTGHTHTTNDITNLSIYSGFSNYYIKTDINNFLNSKANTGTTLSSYGITDAYTKLSVDTLLNQKSSTGHTHTEFNNNVTINGNLYVSGTTISLDVLNLNVEDNIILINSGETNSGVTKGSAGIEVDRGQLENYQFLFDESTDTFRIGQVGNLHPVATREDNPTDGYIITWDSINYRFNASINPTIFSSSAHTHSTSSIVDLSSYSGFSNYYTKSTTDNLLNSKANTGTTLSSYGITDAYTKSNVDTLLVGYSITGHTHTTNNITDIFLYSGFTNYYTKTTTDNLLNSKANTGTTLSSYGITDAYTKTATDTLLNGKSNTGHTHTTTDITNLSSYSGFSSYYTKLQVDAMLTGYTSILTFNTFTGTTLPANYLTIGNFNTFTGTTLPTNYYTKTQVDTMLTGYTPVSTFNTYTGSTATDISSRLLTTTFNTFTGTTLPANYYTKTNVDSLLTGYTSTLTFNTYTGNTATDISNRLLTSTFNTFTGTTLPANYLTIVNFNTFTGTTLPTNYYTKTQVNTMLTGYTAVSTFNTYTGNTATDISSRLLISTFNTFTGTTLPANYLTIGNFNIFTGTTLPTNYYTKTQVNTILTGYTSVSTYTTFTGTTLPANYVSLSTYNTFTGTTLPTNYYTKTQTDTLLNGKSNTGHTHTTANITDISSYSGFTNYYIKADTDAQFIKGTAVDATNIADGRSLVYDNVSGKIIYKTMLDTPPTVQARRTTTLVVPNTWTNITFDATDIENKPASAYHDNTNTDRIYVVDSGLYEIKFQTQSNATSTTKLDARVLLNGITSINGGTNVTSTYTADIHIMYINAITYLSGGSYIIAQVLSTVNNGSTLSGDTKMIVTKLDGIVGAQGATGAGSNVIIKNNSVNLANTPHSSLNFTGGISAVDAGSGVATISSPLYGTEFHYAYESGATTMTGTTYLTKLTLVTSVLSGGTYKITAAYGINKGVTTTDLLNRVMVDGVMIGYVHNYELSDTASYLYTTRVFFATLSAASHTILLQFANETSGTITMRDCSLELIRVS